LKAATDVTQANDGKADDESKEDGEEGKEENSATQQSSGDADDNCDLNSQSK